MRNRYPGVCYRCGEAVAPGEGHFERQRGVFIVQHATCAIERRGDEQGREEAVTATQARKFFDPIP